LSRRIPLYLDQVQREKEERAAQRTVKEKSQEIRACEGAAAEKIERQHRIAAARFESDERAEVSCRDDERSDHRWMREGEARRFDQPENERAKTDRSEKRAGEIEAPSRVADAFRDVPHRDRDN